MGVVEQRLQFAAQDAPVLAAQLGDRLELFKPGPSLSKRFVFMHDSRRLVVLAGPQERQHDVDKALALGDGSMFPIDVLSIRWLRMNSSRSEL